MEVQSHGNVFEDILIRKFCGTSKKEYESLIENAYTSPMDIHAGVLSDKNFSIKTSKGNGVGLGDMVTFFGEVKSKEFRMVVGVWDQVNPENKSFHTVYEFQITPEHHKTLFGNLSRASVVEFRDWIKSIPEGPEGAIKNRTIWKEKRDLLEDKYKPIVKFAAKIDSKKQRRLQCSISIDDLISAGIKHRTYRKKYRGIQLPISVKGGARKFEKSKSSK